jgi:hypothetical protein
MNISSMILFACLAGTALAQENTPLPKKDPFAGFGSSLDRRPGGQAGGTLLDRGPGGSVTTPSIGAGNSKPGEIALPGNWSAPLPESSGGHSLEIQDLKALLGPYGKPDDSLATPPGVMIYPGIRYLAPQAEAARILGASGITTSHKIACGGFPDGLSYTSYDGKWESVFNRLYLVTDLAHQMVCLEFVAESARNIPHLPPWRPVTVTRHVLDYVNSMVTAQRRSPATFLYTTGSGLVVDTVSHQTARWYAPKPMINLILFCVENSGAR